MKEKNTERAASPVGAPSERRSAKFMEAREQLPEELREVYDLLVDQYHFATFEKYGSGYVAYPVLAELIRLGWRPTSADPPSAE